MPTMNPADLWTLGSNAAASLLGGWIGAAWAFRKMRRERAFERQLGWHEEMAQNLYKMAAVFDALGRVPVSQIPSSPHFPTLFAEIVRLSDLGQRANLYATPKSRALVQNAITKIQITSESENFPSGPDANEAAIASDLANLVPTLRNAADGLAADVRKQLGLRKLRLRQHKA